MFKIGELIVYGNTGVCRVEAIGPSSLSGADSTKDYYSLVPYYSGRSRIFIPCDNERVVMRAIITREEAAKLLDDIPDIDPVVVDQEKNREAIYKNTIRSCNCREIIGLIKMIHSRKMARIAEGKKITANDEKYCAQAEDKLYGELAIALDIPKEKVQVSVRERIDRNC